MITKHRVFESLREICVMNDWFNAGTNEQYEKMFDLAHQLVNEYISQKGTGIITAAAQYAVVRLADVIWICTDGAEREKINTRLIDWFKQMCRESEQFDELV